MEIALGVRPAAYTKAFNILAFSVFTALGARLCIYLPFTPIPITFQTFFVVLSGAFLGYRAGAASQLVYVFSGLAGLPVFSGGSSGLGMLLGPTGGYLAGFVVSSMFTGLARKNGDGSGFIHSWLIFFAGILIIYFFGALNLSIMYGFSISETFQKGILPFIPGDILKSALAAGISKKLISAVRLADD